MTPGQPKGRITMPKPGTTGIWHGVSNAFAETVVCIQENLNISCIIFPFLDLEKGFMYK